MNDWKPVKVSVGAITLPDPFDVESWLEEQEAHYQWLLAHDYAGVIWGRRFEQSWELSSDLIPSSPPLRAASLLQLRLFGEEGEIFIWRAGGQLHARRVLEGEQGEASLDVVDETQVLWGSKGQEINNHFTRLEDGEQGMVHAVPLALGEFDAQSRRPVRLHVRHYVTRDKETGLARIGYSRLRTLTNNEVKQNGS